MNGASIISGIEFTQTEGNKSRCEVCKKIISNLLLLAHSLVHKDGDFRNMPVLNDRKLEKTEIENKEQCPQISKISKLSEAQEKRESELKNIGRREWRYFESNQPMEEDKNIESLGKVKNKDNRLWWIVIAKQNKSMFERVFETYVRCSSLQVRKMFRVWMKFVGVY